MQLEELFELSAKISVTGGVSAYFRLSILPTMVGVWCPSGLRPVAQSDQIEGRTKGWQRHSDQSDTGPQSFPRRPGPVAADIAQASKDRSQARIHQRYQKWDNAARNRQASPR